MTARVPVGASPAANTAVRWMTMLGIATREETREFLTRLVIAQRRVPPLSLDDVRMLLDPTRWSGTDERPSTEEFDPSEMPPRQRGVRTNLEPDEEL